MWFDLFIVFISHILYAVHLKELTQNISTYHLVQWFSTLEELTLQDFFLRAPGAGFHFRQIKSGTSGGGERHAVLKSPQMIPICNKSWDLQILASSLTVQETQSNQLPILETKIGK